MNSVTIKNVLLGSVAIAVSAGAFILSSRLRSFSFRYDYDAAAVDKKYFLDAEDEEVMTNPLESDYPLLAIRRDVFSSTDTSQDSSLLPEVTFALSVEVFDSSLKNLADVSKWPAPYFHTDKHRREAERLALYLLGVADTYMGSGPNTINVNSSTHLSITLLYLCAANLGIQEAFTTKLAQPRTLYGLVENRGTSIVSQRIVEQSSRHAISNSVITFYELIVLYLLSVEEDRSAAQLMEKLKKTNRTRAFLAFVYLRNGQWKAFRHIIADIISSVDANFPLLPQLEVYKQLKEEPNLETRLARFDLPRLCSVFTEPFAGVATDS